MCGQFRQTEELGWPLLVGKIRDTWGVTLSQPAGRAPRVRRVLRWSESVLHQIFFDKYLLGNALIACFEEVFGIHFNNIFSHFLSQLPGSCRHTLKSSKESMSQHLKERKHYQFCVNLSFFWVKLLINEQIMIVENTGHLTSQKGARDKMPQIRDIPYCTGWVATL